MVLEIEFNSAGGEAASELPVALMQRHRFVFRVEIDSPPEEKLEAPKPPPPPAVDVRLRRPLQLARGTTRRPLPKDLFIVFDGGRESGVAFKVLNGTLFVGDDNHPATRFSLADVTAGNVEYQTGGSGDSGRAFSVRVLSGGPILTIPVETFALRVIEVNNTGIAVAHNASTDITSFNLTFTTNAPDQAFNIR